MYICSMEIPIESLNLQMLNIGLAKHNGDWNWKNVSSPFTRIFYVTEGQAKLHLPSGAVELKPKHLYIIPAYTIHSYECDGLFTHYYLHVYEGFKKETDVFDFYTFPTEVDSKEDDNIIFKRLCEIYPEVALPGSDPKSYDNTNKFTDYVRRYNEMDLYEKMYIRGCMLILFSRFMHYAQPKVWTNDERLARVLKYIHNNIYDDIDIDNLASVACVTKPYLIRLFSKNLGISPLQYINRKKMERAQLLLITKDMPIKELAYTLGYNDHSYFIRVFKKLIGITPQEYRMTMR